MESSIGNYLKNLNDAMHHNGRLEDNLEYSTVFVAVSPTPDEHGIVVNRVKFTLPVPNREITYTNNEKTVIYVETVDTLDDVAWFTTERGDKVHFQLSVDECGRVDAVRM